MFMITIFGPDKEVKKGPFQSIKVGKGLVFGFDEQGSHRIARLTPRNDGMQCWEIDGELSPTWPLFRIDPV